MSNFLDAVNRLVDLEKSRGGGSGGYYCKGKLYFAYKIFVSGLGNEESTFKFAIDNDKSREEALKQARSIIEKLELTPEQKKRSGPSACFVIEVAKEDVFDREVEWKQNRFFLAVTYANEFEKIVRPTFEKIASVPIPEDSFYWIRISFAEGTKMRKDDPTKPELVAFVADVYKDKNELLIAMAEHKKEKPEQQPGLVSEKSNGKQKPTAPTGWDMPSWESMFETIAAEIKGGASPAKVATDYVVSVQDVVAVKKYMEV